MRHFGVDFVVAGADQVALNGDTANKIGTYSLAINAKHHSIPFFICTPMSSVNVRLADGSGIRVEERPPNELTHWNGIYEIWNY
jgi:methylthioribose-1-phosphate isomerase